MSITTGKIFQILDSLQRRDTVIETTCAGMDGNRLLIFLKRRIAFLEFELRFETDAKEKEHIATERDRLQRELDSMT